MDTPLQVLVPHREEIPQWLNVGAPLRLTPGNVTNVLASRTVYYPGSGTDGHALRLFGGSHSAHCLVHCDSDLSIVDEVRRQLHPEHRLHPKGYGPLFQQDLSAQEVQLLCIDPSDHWHPDGVGDWQTARLTGGIWAVLERQHDFDDTHGPTRLAFLHICADAIWTHRALWNGRAVPPYGIVLQDHGYGGRVCNFGADSPLSQVVEPTARPKWLLVAENTEPWPGYERASDIEPGGMHSHGRCLYKSQA
jgi:hypothetical protein